MTMTDEEIKQEYLEAKHPKRQIGILADQNCCTRNEIVKRLKDLGAIEESEESEEKMNSRGKSRTPIDENKFWELYSADLTDAEIAAQMGETEARVAKFRREKKLKKNKPQEGKRVKEKSSKDKDMKVICKSIKYAIEGQDKITFEINVVDETVTFLTPMGNLAISFDLIGIIKEIIEEVKD